MIYGNKFYNFNLMTTESCLDIIEKDYLTIINLSEASNINSINIFDNMKKVFDGISELIDKLINIIKNLLSKGIDKVISLGNRTIGALIRLNEKLKKKEKDESVVEVENEAVNILDNGDGIFVIENIPEYNSGSTIKCKELCNKIEYLLNSIIYSIKEIKRVMDITYRKADINDQSFISWKEGMQVKFKDYKNKYDEVSNELKSAMKDKFSMSVRNIYVSNRIENIHYNRDAIDTIRDFQNSLNNMKSSFTELLKANNNSRKILQEYKKEMQNKKTDDFSVALQNVSKDPIEISINVFKEQILLNKESINVIREALVETAKQYLAIISITGEKEDPKMYTDIIDKNSKMYKI